MNFHKILKRYILLLIATVMFINQSDCHPIQNGNRRHIATNYKQVGQSDNGNTNKLSSAAFQKLQSQISDNGYVINGQLRNVLSQYFDQRYKILPVFKINVNIFEDILPKMTSNLQPTSDSELLLDREMHLRHGFKRSMHPTHRFVFDAEGNKSIITKIRAGVLMTPTDIEEVKRNSSSAKIGSGIPFTNQQTISEAKYRSDEVDNKFMKYSKNDSFIIKEKIGDNERLRVKTQDKTTGIEAEENMKPVFELVEFIKKKQNEFEINKQNEDDDRAPKIVSEMKQNVKDSHTKSAEKLFTGKLESSKSTQNILRSAGIGSLPNMQTLQHVEDQILKRDKDIEVAIHTGDSIPKKLYKIVETKIIDLASNTEVIPEKFLKQIVPNDSLEADTKLTSVDTLHSYREIPQIQEEPTPPTVGTVEFTEGKVIILKDPKYLPTSKNPGSRESRPIENQKGRANINSSIPELPVIRPGNISSESGITEDNETHNIQRSQSQLSAEKSFLESNAFQGLEAGNAVLNNKTFFSKNLTEQLVLLPRDVQYQHGKSTQRRKSGLLDQQAKDALLEEKELEHDKTIDHKKNSFDDIKFEELLSPPNKELEGRDNKLNSKPDFSNLAAEEPYAKLEEERAINKSKTDHYRFGDSEKRKITSFGQPDMSAEEFPSQSPPIKELEMKKPEVLPKWPAHMIKDLEDDDDRKLDLSTQPNKPSIPRAIKEFQDMPAKTKPLATTAIGQSESKQTIYQPVLSALREVTPNEELHGENVGFFDSSKHIPTFTHGARSQSRKKLRNSESNDDVELTNEQLLRYLENDRLHEIIQTRQFK